MGINVTKMQSHY